MPPKTVGMLDLAKGCQPYCIKKRPFGPAFELVNKGIVVRFKVSRAAEASAPSVFLIGLVVNALGPQNALRD
jgi:hypothetical protein